MAEARSLLVPKVKASARGGDYKSKGATDALGFILFRSLPPGKQQRVEREVKSGELVVYPSDVNAPEDQSIVVEAMIAMVAKASVSDSIRRKESPHRKASSCVRLKGETTGAFLERYLSSAQAYLNIANGDWVSSESENLDMALLTNAKL